jgi:hypothetical protein
MDPPAKVLRPSAPVNDEERECPGGRGCGELRRGAVGRGGVNGGGTGERRSFVLVDVECSCGWGWGCDFDFDIEGERLRSAGRGAVEGPGELDVDVGFEFENEAPKVLISSGWKRPLRKEFFIYQIKSVGSPKVIDDGDEKKDRITLKSATLVSSSSSSAAKSE